MKGEWKNLGEVKRSGKGKKIMKYDIFQTLPSGETLNSVLWSESWPVYEIERVLTIVDRLLLLNVPSIIAKTKNSISDNHHIIGS